MQKRTNLLLEKSSQRIYFDFYIEPSGFPYRKTTPVPNHKQNRNHE